MNRIKPIVGIFLLAVLVSCGPKYKLQFKAPKTIKIDEKLQISVIEKNGNPIDSIHYYLNGKRLVHNQNQDISNFKLGKQALSAEVFYKGKSKTLNNTIYFLSDKAPEVYTYTIVNEFPHDEEAFTQGFEYHDNFFYESTGQYGESTLRKIEVETGKIVKKIDLDEKYFAEGMTILNGKIFQLTWKENVGFIYGLESFKKEGTFRYGQSKEGWGLANDGSRLIKTDGSERMWFLNAKTQKEESYIETYTNKRKAEKLNELEYIKGKIYANIWQQNSLLIINPNTGAIESIVNLKGLQQKAGQSGEDNVLNGIAYDKVNDRLFVTGKRWSKVFEIKIVKK